MVSGSSLRGALFLIEKGVGKEVKIFLTNAFFI